MTTKHDQAKQQLKAFLFPGVFIALALGGCAQPPPPQMPVSMVQTVKLQKHTVTESSQYLANLISRRSVTLQPRVDAQITYINAHPGDVVKAGQVLIQLDARQQQAALVGLGAAQQSAQQDLINSRQGLRSLQATRQANLAALLFARQQYERFSILYSQNSTSKQLLDQYTEQYDQAKATLKQTDAQISAQRATIARAASSINQARANIAGQQSQLSYYVITAPFSGTVGDVPVKLGSFVSTSTPLLTITDDKNLEINVAIPVEKAAQLRTGMTLDLVNADNKPLGAAKVFFVAPSTSADSQTILIKARYDNASGPLRADQVVRTKVIWQTRPSLTVPVLAVTHNANLNFVYLPAASKKSPSGLIARMLPVTLGDINGNDYVVKAGLNVGDEVIISGVQSLAPNMPIKVQH